MTKVTRVAGQPVKGITTPYSPVEPLEEPTDKQNKWAIIMELYVLWTRHPELTLAQLIAKACRTPASVLPDGTMIDGWVGFVQMDDLQLIRHLVGHYQHTS